MSQLRRVRPLAVRHAVQELRARHGRAREEAQSDGAESRVADYQDKLEALNTRMEVLLARYTKQFGIMESVVGQSNAMREGLTSTFEGMMAMYTK